ncbi:MAG: hypothetical protein ACT6FG_00410 [Methanosarcinaceae archaeon]
MVKVKLILFISALLLLSCPASADNWFNATLGEQAVDLEEGLILLLYAVITIYLIVCFVLTLYGWKFHNRAIFKNGLIGFGVFIAMVVIYGFAIEFFEYYAGKYW